jgi:heme/copper-type cytochrome/quinol oxidase subunit 4
MIIIKNRNIKNSYLVIGFVVSIILIIIGALLKINKIESGNTFLICGLIVKVQVVLMLIYKYGYQIRQSLAK